MYQKYVRASLLFVLFPLGLTRKGSCHSKCNYFGEEDKRPNDQAKAKLTVCWFWRPLHSMEWHSVQKCQGYRFGRPQSPSSHGRVDLSAESLARKRALWHASLVLCSWEQAAASLPDQPSASLPAAQLSRTCETTCLNLSLHNANLATLHFFYIFKLLTFLRTGKSCR